MTIEDQLKDAILYRYKSIREFANTANMAYSTVDSVLKRGIVNSGVGTVIKIFSLLDLDMESIPAGMLSKKSSQNGKSPDTEEPVSGDEEKRIFKCILPALISAGIIREGQDLTDGQADILIAVCEILRVAFEN